MKKIINLITFLSVLLLISCANENFETSSQPKISIDLTGETVQGGQNLLLIDEGNPNNKYCRIDSIIQYGYGVTYYLPDSLKEADLKILVKAKCRESVLPASGSLCLALYDINENIAYWAETPAAKYVSSPNIWTDINDSLIISADKNNFNSKCIKFFSRKISGKGNFDVDNLTIEIIKE